jgi:ubiquitin carboxyl-terminal hydrolase L3
MPQLIEQIPNACGSIGLLHALLNLPASGPYALKPDSPLLRFKAASLALSRKSRRPSHTFVADQYITAVDRAKLLDEADFFEAAHSAAAQAGQSAVPEDLDVDTHFIAFIEAENAKGYGSLPVEDITVAGVVDLR